MKTIHNMSQQTGFHAGKTFAWQLLHFKHILNVKSFKWYYDQKITFIFSSDFETLFTKHSPSEILSLNFDKKTVYSNCNFPI